MTRAEGGISNRPGGCAADPLMKLLAKEWTTHVIWALRTNGTSRFGVLRRSLPGNVSARVLSARLKELESAGIVHRRELGDKLMHVEYSLSESGMLIDGDILRLEGRLEAVQVADA